MPSHPHHRVPSATPFDAACARVPRSRPTVALSLAALFLAALGQPGTTLAQATPQAAKDAQPAVQRAHATMAADLPWADQRDEEDAKRGLIAELPGGRITAGERDAWNLGDYQFLSSPDAPATVNPSLWRQARLNMHNGLFKVAERVYQVRGLDLSNMTIIEGDEGLILIDPLTTVEVARAGLALYYAHRPRRPVKAVIYSHSHADHFGGVKGVVDEADVKAGRVSIIAPDGFLEHAVSENVIAGVAMIRRAAYQFGLLLARGERGQVDAGLGKAVSLGTVSLIAPTEVITKPIDARTVDGVKIEFQLAPGTEAPAEMHMYFPDLRLLNLAENATHTFHNLLPLRGAEVRDALGWSRYLNEAIERYGARSDVLIAQHHWPTWGSDRVNQLLRVQRDQYKYVHDQTLRLINYGYTPDEIAEQLKLPPSLAGQWSLRDYYGTVRHNARAIYQRYLGWYDANPAHLDPLPPTPRATRYVDYMGGADAVVLKAREDFAKGQYRWVVDVLNQVVFAQPDHAGARALLADAYEQLGYTAESATWRNAYLNGASELRKGVPPATARGLSPDLLQALSLDMYFDLMGVRLNGDRARDQRLVLNWNFTDTGQQYVLNLENSALTWVSGRQSKAADASLSLSRATLDAITLRRTSFVDAARSGDLKIDGDPRAFATLMGLLDPFNPSFEIVEPRKVNAP